MAQTVSVERRYVPTRAAPERGSVEDFRRVIERILRNIKAIFKRLDETELKVTTITATAFTFTRSDEFAILDATSNNVTASLPITHAIGETYTAIREDASGNTATLDGNGSSISGSASTTLSQYDAIRVVSNGTGWFIY